MKYDYEIETIIGHLTPKDFLDELAEQYDQLTGSVAEVKGNAIYFYNYQGAYSSDTEDFELRLYDNRLRIYRRDEYREISRLEFFAFLDVLDKADEGSEVIEFTLSSPEDKDCDGIFKIGDTKLVYYNSGKLFVDTIGLHHHDSLLFERKWQKKLARTDLVAIDAKTTPF